MGYRSIRRWGAAGRVGTSVLCISAGVDTVTAGGRTLRAQRQSLHVA